MKLAGVILIIAGFAVLIGNFLFKTAIQKLPFLGSKSAYILIAGIILIFAGLAFGSGRKKQKEVPIYDKKGKQIVGYRRMKAL